MPDTILGAHARVIKGCRAKWIKKSATRRAVCAFAITYFDDMVIDGACLYTRRKCLANTGMKA